MNLLLFNLRTDSSDTALGFTSEWIANLSYYFENVYVVTLSVGCLDLPSNVFVYSLKRRKDTPKILQLLIFYKLVLKIFITSDIHCVFSHMAVRFSILSGPITKFLRMRHILWYAHGSVPFELSIANKLVSGVITSSEFGYRLHHKNKLVAGQAIDIERFKMIPLANKDPFKILTVGRISRIKNIHICIKALSKVCRIANLPYTYDIYGAPIDQDGYNYLKSLESLVLREQLGDIVKFHGPVPFSSVQECYMEGSLFVNNSDTNSVDKTILEAMACGIPIITSNDSFKLILPSNLKKFSIIEKHNEDQLVARISDYAEMTSEEKDTLSLHSRQYVCENHSSACFFNKLFDFLSKGKHD